MESDSQTNSANGAARKGPNDFVFGRILGEGSFSTVCFFSNQIFVYRILLRKFK